jgi:hypothetical protein
MTSSSLKSSAFDVDEKLKKQSKQSINRLSLLTDWIGLDWIHIVFSPDF